MKTRIACLVVVGAVLTACVPSQLTSTPTPVVPTPTPVVSQQAPKLIIGSLYITPTQTPWSAAHKAALKNALSDLGRVEEKGDNFQVFDQRGNLLVEVLSWTVSDDYSATAALRAAESMIQQGAKLLFVTAEDWCKELHDYFAPAHPAVNFACIRSEVGPNLISMYPKSWVGFCAACAAAATVVEEPIVGLGGAYENNPQVASNHGACAACFVDAWKSLGNKAEPRFSTVYINSWGNEPDEHQAALALADEGCQVIAVHQDSTEYAEALAEDADWVNNDWVWAIGYDRDWSQFTSPNRHILTSVIIDWTEVYKIALQMALDGDFRGFRWNPGFEGGAIKLAPFSPAASPTTAKIAAEYQRKLGEGWRPCGSDEVMWSMDHWTQCYQPK